MTKLWVNIELLSGSSRLSVPAALAGTLPGEVGLCFGQRSCQAAAALAEGQSGLSYYTPARLGVTADILGTLAIEPALTYQLRYSEGQLWLGPVIGLLLGEQRYYYHERFMREFTDGLAAYDQFGGLVVAFKSCGIDWTQGLVYGLYYFPPTQGWHYGIAPLPQVVFRRAFKKTESTARELSGVTDGLVFNSYRLDKWQLYEKLRQYPSLSGYLPFTARLNSVDTVLALLAAYQGVILKPAGLSRGRGICILRLAAGNRVFVHNYDGREAVLELELGGLPGYLTKCRFAERDYIVQQLLSLAAINGSPWDIRIVMQKDELLCWRCHGIECRLAGANNLVTNISRGGQALFINQAAKLAFGSRVHPGKMKAEVIALAQEFCRVMDQSGEHYAEFGLDIAVDTERRYWLIEANVRPSFNGFKRLSMANYQLICQTPFLYAAALAGFGKERQS